MNDGKPIPIEREDRIEFVEVSIASDPITHLLFGTHPLIKTVRGDQRDFLRRAWIAAAKHKAMGQMKIDTTGRLPADPIEASFALFDEQLKMMRALGILPKQLTDRITAQAESGALGGIYKPDDVQERMIALLMILVARRLERGEA